MRKIVFSWILPIFNVSVCLLSVWFYARGSLAPVNESNGIEYKDLVAILLTALGVMIAVAAIVLGIAAVWGYKTLKDEAIRAATRTAKRISKEIARETAELIAREVASATAAREIRGNSIPVETPADEAQNIASAMDCDPSENLLREDGNGSTLENGDGNE